MYRGVSAINLDDKGRLTMPTRYRVRLLETCAGKLVITIDTEETCLLLYPLSEWEIIESKIAALSSFNKATRRIQRLLIGHATEVEMDKQGRLLVPPPLREYAGFEKNKSTMLVGQGKKFELWAEDQWVASRDQWLTEAGDSESGIPDELLNLSL